MTQEVLLRMLKKSHAILSGHFLLSSGLHSNKYIQCALVLQYPHLAEKLARLLVNKLTHLLTYSLTHSIDVVISPAIGGIILGYEIARLLNARAIFTEREDKTMQLRRGFTINKGEKILIVEDVVTTGKSTQEVIDVVKNYHGEIVAVASIIDRTKEPISFGCPYISLIKLDIETFSAEKCLLCKKGLPLTKPGSRKFSI